MQFQNVIDYSQNGEQRVILDYFKPPRWEYLVGTQLDIGANDGQTFSNSRMLALMGWKTILVEPSASAFNRLEALYAGEPRAGLSTGVCLINAAITNTDGEIDFWDSGTHLNKGDTSLLSTTHHDQLARWRKSGEQFTHTKVRGITFETLLKETGLTHADFITIDAEGADFDILRQIDLTALGCRLLCVEFNQKDEARFVEYAVKHGMRLMWKNFENLLFCVP